MGVAKKGSDAELIDLVRRYGKAEAARRLGSNPRNVGRRVAHLERKYLTPITSPQPNALPPSEFTLHPKPLQVDIQSGIIIIGSDAHVWPGPLSTAMRGFIKFCRDLKPKVVIMNGDVMDFPRISRHPPIGWAQTPTVVEEIEAAQDALHEVEMAAGRARKIWPAGNHDLRFETKLHTVAPEFAEIAGLSLGDHFTLWEKCWAVDINDDIVVKHRFKGGLHAPHNNTMWSGKTMITGHLHSAKVQPFTDYNGIRYGVDTGCLADTSHRAFTDYTEMNPLNWRSGFCVLTFKDGKLLMPELVLKWDEKHVQFRGELVKV